MAANQAPTAVEVDNGEGYSADVQTDERSRYFEHDKPTREALLRDQANTESVQIALESVFASIQWQEQRGELDRFLLQALLAIHQEPDGGDSFHCTFKGCNYTNGESTNAVEHIRGTTHFGNRPFLCPDCDWAFTRKHDCNTHQAVHSSVRPFRCRYCTQDFTRASNQLRHERNTHPTLYEDPSEAA